MKAGYGGDPSTLLKRAAAKTAYLEVTTINIQGRRVTGKSTPRQISSEALKLYNVQRASTVHSGANNQRDFTALPGLDRVARDQ